MRPVLASCFQNFPWNFLCALPCCRPAYAGLSSSMVYLRFAVIPSMTVKLGEDCFEGCTRLTIVCPAGSTAESYASQHGIDCQIID